MKKTNLIFLISTAIFFTSTLVLIYLNYLKPRSSSIPTTVITPTETTDPTADWEIFEDTQFGISFYYPKDWSVAKETSGLYIISPETSNNMLDTNNTWTRIGDIIISKITKDKLPNNKNNLPLTQWISSDEAINYGINQPATSYNLGGLMGYKVNSCGEMCVEEVYLESNDIIYKIDSGNYDRFTGVFSQILSTFKFISSITPTKSAASSAVNNNLKTYTSSLYGFSFQYPTRTNIIGDMDSHIFSLNIDSKIISVLISSNPEKLNTSEFFLNQISSENPDSLKDYLKFSTEKYNGNTFTQVTQDPTYFKQQSGALNHYLISSKNYIIDFSYSEAGEIINQILSTFKFL